jgi:hypothetical protein
MNVDAVAGSALQRNVSRFFAAALLVVICVEAQPVSAAECGPNCDLNAQPSLYGDPRCVPRPIVPKDTPTPFPAFHSNGPHCDFQVRRRQTHHHPPSVTPQTPSASAAALRRAPGAGKNVLVNGANQSGAGGKPGTGASDPGTAATDPGRQVPRSVDRDVGFADAFGTRVDELHAAPRAGGMGAGGLGVGAGGVGVGGVGAGGLGIGAGGVARGRP